MADADLDVVIRQTAKLQNKTLMAAVKARRDRYLGLAAKAKDKVGKERFKQLAADATEQGTAAARRLQMSADNAADSYARSMRMAADVFAAKASASKASAEKALADKATTEATKPAAAAKKAVKAKKVVKKKKKS
jgi:hypothetical protein